MPHAEDAFFLFPDPPEIPFPSHRIRESAVKGRGRARFRKSIPAPYGSKRRDVGRRRGRIDLPASLFHAWKRGRGYLKPADLRTPVFEAPASHLILILLDVSDSMASTLKLVRRWISRGIGKAYFQRDPVAIITVQGNTADLLVRPTISLEFVRHRLSTLRVGGGTPLDHGLVLARRLVLQWRDRYPAIDLQILSDGRSTSPLSTPGVERAVKALRRHVRRIAVINPQPAARTYAQDLAKLLGADYVVLSSGRRSRSELNAEGSAKDRSLSAMGIISSWVES